MLQPGNRQASISRALMARSASMRPVIQTIDKVIGRDAGVLLEGESGVGKDHVAQLIHSDGPRKSFPFVRIDCASIPAELFESELFGYEKGAFTDAVTRKQGKLEEAHRGTVYFDEVGTLALPLQAKMLRVIQEHRFSRLGGTRLIDADLRVISSSNVPLQRLIDSGSFRKDLFYRLNVVSITLPPLRERREDIPLLARAFLRDVKRREGTVAAKISGEAMELLCNFRWPGNLRELRGVIERAAILESGTVITPESLPVERFLAAPALGNIACEAEWSLDTLERWYIREVLRKTSRNFSRAAEILGINRKTLLEKRRKYGLE